MIEPMKAVLADTPFSDPDWIFERKLDGIRCLAIKDDSGVSLMSRTARRMNDQFPEVAAALEREPSRDFIADGELVAFEGNRTSFARLQQRARKRVPVFLYVFDLPRHEGEDLRALPLRERKARLRRALDFEGPIRFNPHRNGEHGEELYREACRNGLEGVIAKRADSPYRGSRSRDWLKLKCHAEQELVIGGFTAPKGSRDRVRRAAGGLQRGRRAPLRREGRHRLRPGDAAASLGAQLRELRAGRVAVRALQAGPAGHALGAARSSWPRSAFAEWTSDAACATRATSACATTSRPSEVVREVPS